MSNSSRIRNAIFDKEGDDSSVSNSGNLYQEQEPSFDTSSEESIILSQDEIYKEKFNWIGEIANFIWSIFWIFILYFFAVGFMILLSLALIDQGHSYMGWFVGLFFGGLMIFCFIRDLLKHLNTLVKKIRS